MNIKGFLDCIDRDAGWRLDGQGNLRDANDYCPLWHVYYWRFERDDDEDDDALDYIAAGRRCGLRARDADAIAQAADRRGSPRLRSRILTMLELTEVAPAQEEQP